MAEQWKALAKAETLALIQATEQPHGPLGPHFREATEQLQRRTGQLHRWNRGGVVRWQQVNMVLPTTFLREAARALALYNDRHKRVVRVFSLYGQTIGALTDGPLWQTHLAAGGPQPQAASQLWQAWAQHRAVALDSPDQVRHSLRAVAAFNLATVDAASVAKTLPENSASWNAWMRAAENLAVRADAAAQQASQGQSAMCNAVSGLYNVGATILLQ